MIHRSPQTDPVWAKVAQELARHSTPTLTIGRYAHARLHDLTAALNALPTASQSGYQPEAADVRATGTESATPDTGYPRNTPSSTANSRSAKWRIQSAAGRDERGPETDGVNSRKPLVFAGEREPARAEATRRGNGNSRIRTSGRFSGKAQVD